MMKFNLIGNYTGQYQVSAVEWMLGILNLVLQVGLDIWQKAFDWLRIALTL